MRQWTDNHGEDGLRAKFAVYKPKDRLMALLNPAADIHSYLGAHEIGADGEFVFVMRPETDEAAYYALLQYADACEYRAPKLAADIRSRLRSIHCSRERA